MKIFFVDSFTHEPFKGNPAAVCFVNSDISTKKMLDVATEIGFSETAFLTMTEKAHVYNIRYFSPKKEIPLCGHATLAAAKVIFNEIDAPQDILFLTGQKIELPVRFAGNNIEMSFPVFTTTTLENPVKILQALGIPEVIQTSYNDETKIILLEIESADNLAALKPDFPALIHSYQGIDGVLVTTKSDTTDFDFYYRYFWPWAGTDEDPVTGGVQTFLAKYWAEKLNKSKMNAFQSSARTGYMTVELIEDKVHIFGQAVIVMEGYLKIFE